METKICKFCNIEKNLLDFHKRVGSKDGVRNECKKCTRIRINEYRQKNKENVNKLNRESYYKHIEKRKESSKKYRDNNDRRRNNNRRNDRRKYDDRNNFDKKKKSFFQKIFSFGDR